MVVLDVLKEENEIFGDEVGERDEDGTIFLGVSDGVVERSQFGNFIRICLVNFKVY